LVKYMFVRIKIEGFPHNKCKLSITKLEYLS
jgi:hypothetical protein